MRSIRMGVAAVLVLVVTGCGASVHSSVSPGANLGQYRTYTFRTPVYRRGQPESPAEQELRAALRTNLAARGITEAQPGQQPDFQIAYNVKKQQKLDVQDLGYGYGFYGWGGPVDVTTYTQGTLIVDFVDPQTNKAFWRGTASEVVNNPESPSLAKLDKAVAKLVAQYPATMASTPRPVM